MSKVTRHKVYRLNIDALALNLNFRMQRGRKWN